MRSLCYFVFLNKQFHVDSYIVTMTLTLRQQKYDGYTSVVTCQIGMCLQHTLILTGFPLEFWKGIWVPALLDSPIQISI
jgi:hypothetical protein